METMKNAINWFEIPATDFDRAVLRKGLKPVEKKQRISIMLDAGVIRYFKAKAGKRGYQTLINETLKKAADSGFTGTDRLEDTLRKVIREELATDPRAG